jgi:Na+/proline symporter/signal transduction histidine kinase
MLQGWVILFVSLAYLGLLFAIARYGDKRADAGKSIVTNPYIYALSLGVYCTAWTFYGSVGQASRSGIGYLPIYLGPTLLMLIGWFVLRKMIRISKVNRIISIADFVASRYDKSSLLGGLVTIVAVAGIIPYISLQLKGITTNFVILSSYPEISMPAQIETIPLFRDTAFFVALLLALFAILFGTRHLDVTKHHEGLVAAIAFESVVKLVAFLAVGFFVTFNLYRGFGDVFQQAAANPDLAKLFTIQGGFGTWTWLTYLSMMAIILLPRQFQMAVIENTRETHLNKAIWLFPLYLLLINIFVLPIAFGGLLHFSTETVDPDTFMLTLPIAAGQGALALLAFIGGLSAASSMVIVATVALTTMVSNDLLLPVLLRWPALQLAQRQDLSRLLLIVRRAAIIVILLLSYGYLRLTGHSLTLVSIGLISFAAVAQFAPAVLGGMYWKGGTKFGAAAGLGAGFLVWAYTLPIPSLVDSGIIPQSFVQVGPFGLAVLKPYALFRVDGLDPISHAMVWSMLANVGGYVVVSLLTRQSVVEHRQAIQFVDVFKITTSQERVRLWRGNTPVKTLRSLLGRFMGHERVDNILVRYAGEHGLDWSKQPSADAKLVDFAEKQLAGVIGAASARAMVASVVTEAPITTEEVMDILDETSQVIAYSYQLEQKSKELEAATAELRAANERLQELDRLKDDFMSTVTHELRTPLTSIRAFSEILRDNPDLPSDQRNQFSGIILRESERLTRLINNVLDLSKIESGKMEWALSSFELSEVVNESLATTGQLFREKHIQLELDIAGEGTVIVADRDRIMQVMLNLISNAIKFCDGKAGWVKVSLYAQNGHLRVDVSDNGVGVNPDDVSTIFEKFRQAGNTLTDKPQGTGLGLPICREIISHFGGQLWVENTPGHGATFSFTVPAVAQVATEIV